MVDVGEKPITRRSATARGVVTVNSEAITAIKENALKKGDVLASARIAGIMGAKRTAELVPLAHPIPISSTQVDIGVGDGMVEIVATVQSVGQTGVEMEALTAVCTAALCIYDMCKSIDRRMAISDVVLLEKSGGRSGRWSRGE